MLIPSGRVMLSANLIGGDNAHHRIRHRARHGLRGGVASPLQRFALVVPRRRPRRPRQRPRQQSCHGLCFMPGALAPSMRHTHRVNACRRLVCRVVLTASMVSSIRRRTPGRSTSSCLQQPPTSSFQQQRIRASGPAQNRVAFGHITVSAGVHRAACFRLRLRLRRDTSLCCSGTGSRAPSSHARKRRENRCPCLARTSIPSHAHHPPRKTPAESQVCRPRSSESTLRIPPPRGGQIPPHQPCRPDRDAFGPASRLSCPPCRHVAAFQTKRAHPPPFFKPCSSPTRNPARNAPACCPQPHQMHRLRLRRSRSN